MGPRPVVHGMTPADSGTRYEVSMMSSEVGVWIDHRKAVIATLRGGGESLREIESQMEPHVRYSGAAQEDSAEDQRDRRFDEHLNRYYDEVIECIRQAGSILLLGPGEAKTELERRLRRQGLEGQVVRIEAADKMTDGQIAALVRQHFRKSSHRLVPMIES